MNKKKIIKIPNAIDFKKIKKIKNKKFKKFTVLTIGRFAEKKKGFDLYSGLSKNSSFEEKYKFFRKQISISLNERSGILAIKSLALDPKTAYNFNLFLIGQSEIFVNQLNQSIYKEQLEFLDMQVKMKLKR